MQRLLFTNSRGKTVELGDNPPFILSKIDGLGDVEAENQTQKAPYQDGSTYIDSLLNERIISMEISILAPSKGELSETRRHFSSVFSPKHGEGFLQYIYGNEIKTIKAVPEHVPIYPSGKDNRFDNLQMSIVTLKCANPHWMDLIETEKPLTAWLGKFEFPFEFPVEFGERANRATLVNDGDVSTPVTIDFYGPATNPTVTNETTGEYIKVNRSLGAGDVLEVSTEFGNKTVEIVSADGNRTDVFNYIDLDSSFFQLLTGENEISFSSDDAESSGYVEIRYKNRYLAI
ncbi:phage tail family protein [Neobacillus sp. 114]|uniref:phage tail family protein n=1 Tax=Neobacillus sp. 114 TaxID=3048535 RepID=UPI0024C2389C|nr:phage tail family protein [Neobacillus sp. 114]